MRSKYYVVQTGLGRTLSNVRMNAIETEARPSYLRHRSSVWQTIDFQSSGTASSLPPPDVQKAKIILQGEMIEPTCQRRLTLHLYFSRRREAMTASYLEPPPPLPNEPPCYPASTHYTHDVRIRISNLERLTGSMTDHHPEVTGAGKSPISGF